MHMHMHMVKVISLSEHAYASLKNLKEGSDSFSEVVLRLIHKEKKKSLLSFAGIWKDMPEMDLVFNDILSERHKTKDRKLNLKW